MWFAVRKILPETIFLASFDLFDMLTCQFEDQISQADSQWGIGALEPSRKLGAMRGLPASWSLICAKQGPPSQLAERAGSGMKARSSSKELRGLSVRAQVRA